MVFIQAAIGTRLRTQATPSLHPAGNYHSTGRSCQPLLSSMMEGDDFFFPELLSMHRDSLGILLQASFSPDTCHEMQHCQAQEPFPSFLLGGSDDLFHFVDAPSSFATSMPSPQVLVSSLLLVTASDMVPFVPCQPLAISLGATLGIWAYPICVFGQTLAGVSAFSSSRTAADSQQVQRVLDGLGSKEAREKFKELRQIGTIESEGKVLLALIGLRLAPFFPFSAGNYLLGGGTGVGLRPFVVATLFGCVLSNLLSVSVGIGGSELWQSQLGAT